MMEFLEMGGYGFFVWSAYSLTAVVLILNVYLARKKSREILNALKAKK